MEVDFGEPLERLRAVPIRECGEPLVDPRELSRRVCFAEKHPKFADMPRVPLLRKGVAERIAKAAESLRPGLVVMIIEGFRPMSNQRFMYESLRKELAEGHPEWDEGQLTKHLNDLSAPPDDVSPPPHTTGGAVDLCLVDEATGEYLDMTSPYEWGDDSAPTVIQGLSPEAAGNRQLLARAMEGAGLDNYPGEWWHWRYGDQGWALCTGAPFAIYDRLPDAG